MGLVQRSICARWVVGAHIGPFWSVVGAGRVPVVGLALYVGFGHGVFSLLSVCAERHVDKGLPRFAPRLFN